MGPIGRKNDLVNLIHARTKIKKVDIIEMFKVMPECMAEAFMMSNADEGIGVEMGGIAIAWHSKGKWGPWLEVKPNTRFKTHMATLKIEKTTELAEKMNNLMHPINKERVTNRLLRETRGVTG